MVAVTRARVVLNWQHYHGRGTNAMKTLKIVKSLRPLRQGELIREEDLVLYNDCNGSRHTHFFRTQSAAGQTVRKKDVGSYYRKRKSK